MKFVLGLLLWIAFDVHAADVRPFDSNWRFLKSDAPGAEAPAFDDAAWRTVNLPHDWNIEGPFDSKNPTGGAGAFATAGSAGAAGRAASFLSSSRAGATGSAAGRSRRARLPAAPCDSKSSRLRKSARLAGGLGRGMGGSVR